MTDVHHGQPVLRAGPEPARARLTVILVHGRGGTPDEMLEAAASLGLDDVAFLAPTAAGHTWYPQSFLAPIRQNEPYLTSALGVLGGLLDTLAAGGVPSFRVAFVGFSQGACLTLEFVARHARRYAAVAGLSGGVIGPPDTPREYPGSLDGTPVFLGCSDIDSHIPLARVHESAAVFRALGAKVDEQIYPGMGHLVSDDELARVRAMLAPFGR